MREGNTLGRGAAALLAIFLLGAAAVGTASASEVTGKTTLDLTLAGDESAPYSFLSQGSGESYLVRTDLATPLGGRTSTRDSLIYFGQLSDFQLSDEESPSRVEFFDTDPLELVLELGPPPPGDDARRRDRGNDPPDRTSSDRARCSRATGPAPT